MKTVIQLVNTDIYTGEHAKDYRPPKRVALRVRNATGVCFICCLKMLSSATNSPSASCTERLIGVAGCSLRRFGCSFLHCRNYTVSVHVQMINGVWLCQQGAEWKLACWSLAQHHFGRTQKQACTVNIRTAALKYHLLDNLGTHHMQQYASCFCTDTSSHMSFHMLVHREMCY